MRNEPDLLVLGRRLRHARRIRGLTLADLAKRTGRPPAYLSRLENGRVEPRLGVLGDLAEALDTTTADLLDDAPPDRRAELELELLRAQNHPAYLELGLPPLKPSRRLSDGVLEHLVSLGRAVCEGIPGPVDTTESARRANSELRREMRDRHNYFSDIERIAAEGLSKAGYPGSGPISERVLTELVSSYGFRIERVAGLPRTARSITDTRDRVIFIRDQDHLKVRQARSVVLQTLGHFALEHSDTSDFGDYLRQRIESNYFAAAALAPEEPAVELLSEAKRQGDISVEDLKEMFYISYEMAAHRFTNLATVHLGIPVHFLRTDAEGVITKAYENDGLPFPVTPDGGLEGERVPRQWGARQAWGAVGHFLLHEQYTVLDVGEYFCITYIETEHDRYPYAITLGTTVEHAQHFRGSETLRREHARSRDIEPDPRLVREWEQVAWPSAAERSHVLSALPPSQRSFVPFPGIDLLDVYRFLDRQKRRRQTSP
ncbi:MAG: helix-turn-helix domain-containing protein [Acidimicrobiaceae bacterium]|nr:helix-turn-helix domain-containing protein [Acidimicrobiaceae bacterium]